MWTQEVRDYVRVVKEKKSTLKDSEKEGGR